MGTSKHIERERESAFLFQIVILVIDLICIGRSLMNPKFQSYDGFLYILETALIAYAYN